MEQLAQLEKSINRGVIANIYLFYGEEGYLRSEAVEKLKNFLLSADSVDFNYQVIDGQKDGGSDVVNASDMLPVFADKRLVVVKDPFYLKTGKSGEVKGEASEELLSYLENPNSSTCLVFNVSGKIDKRKKIVKLIHSKGQALHFEPLKGVHLAKWIQEKFSTMDKKISLENAEFVAIAVGDNMILLEREIEKAAAFAEEKEIKREDLEKVVSRTSNLNIFKLMDLVSEKKIVPAADLLKEMTNQGEAPVKVVFLLARHYRLLLKTKLLANRGITGQQLASRLGVMGFVARKLQYQAQSLGAEELITLLDKIHKHEIMMKRGQGDHTLLLENLVYELCRR